MKHVSQCLTLSSGWIVLAIREITLYLPGTEVRAKGMINHIFLSSVQFSHSVMSDSLRPHELQHTRPLCPSPAPGVHSDSHVHRVSDAIQPYHPVIPFSSCPQSLPTSGSFPMSQLFASGGQSIGVSASTSVFPMNTQN